MKTALQKILFTVLFIFISSSVVFTQWTDDPDINLILAKLKNQQKYNKVANNSSGGCIAVWEVDTGNETTVDFDIYAQSYNAAGEKLWAADVPIVTLPKIQRYSQIINDGAGGAIITWNDHRNPDNTWVRDNIYVQRIDANGNIKWNVNGILISKTSAGKTSPQIISDGVGGAVILWTDTPEGAPGGVYGQRIDASGNKLWGQDEILIQQDMALTSIISDGQGGIILTGIRYEKNSDRYYDIYSQKINLLGQAQWANDGIPICTRPKEQIAFLTIEDGTGGAVYFWKETLPPGLSKNNIFAQRVNSSGEIQWILNGISVFKIRDNDRLFMSAVRISSGIILTINLRDIFYNQFLNDIYIQKISLNGQNEWGDNPKLLCDALDDQTHPIILPDGNNGAIISWLDNRLYSYPLDVYAQRINSAGDALWVENGINLTKDSFIHISFPYDGIFLDAGTKQNIKWQSKGTSGFVNIELSTDAGKKWSPISKIEPDDGIFENWIIPNLPSFNCIIRIKDTSSTGPSALSKGNFYIRGLMTYPVDGEVWIAGSAPVIRWNRNGVTGQKVNLDLTTDAGTTWIRLKDKLINDGDWQIPKIPNYPSDKCRLKVTSEYNRNAYIISNGLFTIESPVITISSPAGGEVWKVGGDAVMRWKSNCGSKLVNIELSTNGGTSWTFLKKNLPDDGDWRISVVPNLPSTKCKIRISDIYGYASAISNGYFTISKSRGKLSADNTEAVQLPTEFALDQNYPNPFNPVTSIQYAVSSMQFISLKIYDLLGKEVATLVNEQKAPGYYEVEFNAGNLSSGVYIYRLNAGSFTSTKKLLLMK